MTDYSDIDDHISNLGRLGLRPKMVADHNKRDNLITHDAGNSILEIEVPY